jgi:hypothetical protein
MKTKINKSETVEYSSWESMRQRCNNPNNKHYKNYGGRGIIVCKEWDSFDKFLLDMGYRPEKKYSLDRIDVNGNYCIENCKWSNRYTQDRNRRNSVYLEYKGTTYVLQDLANLVNLHQQTIQARLKKGMSVEEAINKPYKYRKNVVLL